MRRCTALLLVMLSGCSLFPLSAAECRPADWRARGFNDGYFGNPPQDLRLASECSSRYGVTVPQDQYLVGWRDGHDEYDRLWGSMKKNR
jgi:hypothetical protein